MKRSAALIVLLVFVGGPVLAAVPATSMPEHCMDAGMTCHDFAVLSCCSANPLDAATPAVPAQATAVSASAAAATQHVVAVITTDSCCEAAVVGASPPHGHRSGSILSRHSTLLI